MTKYRALLNLALMAACGVLLGCGQSSTTYTVKIEQKGGDGSAVADNFANSVSGTCNTSEGGQRQAHELFGAGNFTASFQGSFISCTASAKNASNALTMTVTRADGSVVGNAQTNAQLRVATVTGS